ncbi:MAG: 6-hydroxymethylpterin diphosphokinase MptE-like protein [Planctomycetota bacterium]
MPGVLVTSMQTTTISDSPASQLPAMAPASFLPCYLKNLEALYQCRPSLAARIEAIPFADCPGLESTRDNNLTVRINGDNERLAYVHSRYRPLEEARQFIETQCVHAANSTEDTGEPKSVTGNSYLVNGMGLGYHLLELDRQQDRPYMVVAENNLGLIKTALCVTDLTGPLGEGRLLLLTSADKGSFHETMQPLSTEVLLGLRALALPHTARCQASFHAQVRGLMADYVAFARVQMVTLLRNARITCKNVAFNLPAYLARPGVEVLQGRAAGYPAVIVAAGPSLARNIEQLGALRERAVIIAVQTVFKTLLARGIRPHFVTSLDFHELSAQFFHGIADVGDCTLVVEPKATWHVLDAFKGRTHVLHHGLYEDLLREDCPARGAIKGGSTVAHLAFYLAEHLGCDPIILVGQDLSYSEGLYYPPGMPIEQIWRPELGRFTTIEMKQWERIVRARALLRVVEDIHGQKTYTDEQLYTYAEQFQRDFAGSPARVIHACEGGMRLSGTEVMTLRAAAERFCHKPLPADSFAAGAELAPPVLRTRAAERLHQRLDEIAKARGIAVEMEGLLEKLSTLVERPAEFNRVVVRVDDLRTLMRRYDRTYKIVVGVSQLAELRRYSADRKIGQQERETAETARRRLQRDRDFVSAFIDGCEYLEGMLPQALERLEGGRS